jgi:hypothetical protein
MIRSSINHVTHDALPLPPFNHRYARSPLSCLLALAYPHAPLVDAAGAMPKQPMAPPDGRKTGKPKNPGLSVKQMSTLVLTQDIPIYFKKQPPRDPEAFVYVEVVQLWPEVGKASLTDARMTKAKHRPLRFFAFFTGGCAGILKKAKPQDKICLYLSDAAIHDVEGQCKQNTLNLPFTLTYDKICRLRCVEKDMVGPPIAFSTGMRPLMPSSGSH